MKNEGLRRFAFKTGFLADKFIADTLYRLQTSKDQRERVKINSELFVSELLSFLGEDTDIKLAPINPTRKQLNLVNFAIDSQLSLDQTFGRGGKFPQHINFYSSKKEPIFNYNVGLIVTSSVRQPYFQGLTIYKNYPEDGMLDFISLPYSPGVLDRMSQLDDRLSAMQVYNNGMRLIFRKSDPEVNQYFFLGSYQSRDLNKRYHYIYGMRNNFSQKEQSSKAVKFKKPLLSGYTM